MPWSIFLDLSAGRPWAVGMAATPLPISRVELRAYLELAGIGRSEWPWIQWCVAVLDAEWLRLTRERTPKSKEPPRGNDGAGTPRH